MFLGDCYPIDPGEQAWWLPGGAAAGLGVGVLVGALRAGLHLARRAAGPVEGGGRGVGTGRPGGHFAATLTGSRQDQRSLRDRPAPPV